MAEKYTDPIPPADEGYYWNWCWYSTQIGRGFDFDRPCSRSAKENERDPRDPKVQKLEHKKKNTGAALHALRLSKRAGPSPLLCMHFDYQRGPAGPSPLLPCQYWVQRSTGNTHPMILNIPRDFDY